MFPRQKAIDQILAAIFVIAGLSNCNVFAQVGVDCRPTVAPVQNFIRSVEEVQATTAELSELMTGPRGAAFKSFLSNSLPVAELKYYLRPLPRLYENKPISAVLNEIAEHSIIFNWEGDNGTAAIIGRIAGDVRRYREQVLSQRQQRIDSLGKVRDAASAVAEVFQLARGLLGKAKNETENVHEEYLGKAFDRLNACLATCGGIKGSNLALIRGRFEKLYGGTSRGQSFEIHMKTLREGDESARKLAADLEADRELISTLANREAANLQSAAELLEDAHRNGRWFTVGEQNQKIKKAAIMIAFGYIPGRRPFPTPEAIDRRVDATYNQAMQVRGFADNFLSEHKLLLEDLKSLLEQYRKAYQPGCRSGTVR